MIAIAGRSSGRHLVRAGTLTLVLIGQVSPATSECPQPGTTRVAVPIFLPKGLGIKRVHFSHDRNENTDFYLDFQTRPNTVHESYRIALLQNRDQVDIVPRNPGIRTGKPDMEVAFSVMGGWHWGYPDRRFEIPRIDRVQQWDRIIDFNFTSCGDPFANTVVTVFFSSSLF
ncbi:hypothetical protein [Bradyrhizobium uaiense]|uniref:Uncharacterized protein n=1 Tax=Bradyrhizobium uaiense TaxID=2594946 RepID=A0A6P1BKD9_9BRAD|nr:hypothetical protein [Bradyrhizobium uaiense]NEU98885.1 hypothetical protein [Bradyrhizobium uaiense]